MNESYFESICAIFDEKSPFLSILDIFWSFFGHFSYSTSINGSLTIELNYLLNWISRFFLNWIMFWIESWVKQYWIEYWKNHFFAKFKHWIESDWVSATTSPVPGLEEMGPVPVVVEEGSAQALAITHSLLSRSFHPFFSLLFGFSWFVLALTLWLLTHTAMKTRMGMMRR